MKQPSKEACISISRLYKHFGPKRVLDGINMQIEEGSSVAVIGASGTGKSVLLKCALGLIEADSGSVRIHGAEMVGASRAERELILSQFGMLFQGGALFDSLPVWENVVFRYRQGKNRQRQHLRDVAMQTLAEVNLEPRVLDLFPAELSGGMQKRVALARAIADKPRILLFDEPTSGLDPITSGVINRLIRSAVDRLGATAITISHDMTSVRAISDRVAMIHEGLIHWYGDVAEMDSVTDPVVDQFVHGRPEGPLTAQVEQR